MNKYLFIGLILILALGMVFVFLQKSQNQPSNTPNLTQRTNNAKQNLAIKFQDSIKSAHFESNTPAHGSIIAGVPINVVIDFDFDLAKPSEIKILKDDQDFGVENTIIDSNKLTLRRKMMTGAPDGLYSVKYKACWPDGSCHEGSFEFAIDKSLANDFEDFTNKPQVDINMTKIKFNPEHLRISQGTEVTWINNDDATHYINTDSHLGHSYYPAQNSRALKKGDNYTLVFNIPGIYPYHCSTHEENMTGSILVE